MSYIISINMSSKIKIDLPKYDKEDLDSMMKVYNTLYYIKYDLEKELDKIKNNVLNTMKKRKWTKYKDEKTNTTINLSIIKHEKLDKTTLKLLLSEEQLSQIIIKKPEEKLIIITPKDRERLIKNVKKE